MNYNKFLMILSVSLLIGCKKTKTETPEVITKKITKTEVVLEKLWKTDTLLKTSEAVRYHADKKIMYVSNIGNVPPNSKDGDGSISILNEAGEIINQNWVTGISAPKGSNFYNNTLYVTDINELVEIDLETGSINNKHLVEDAVFLNDVDIDTNGEVYFTDSNGDKILKLVNNKVEKWLDLPEVNPNGILVEKDRILVVSFKNGDFLSIDKKTKNINVIASVIGGGDGIVAIDEGYVISTWQGEIFFVDKHSKSPKAIKILDTKSEKLNAADISVIPEKNILLVPTFFGNTVMAYKIKVIKT